MWGDYGLLPPGIQIGDSNSRPLSLGLWWLYNAWDLSRFNVLNAQVLTENHDSKTHWDQNLYQNWNQAKTELGTRQQYVPGWPEVVLEQETG